MSTALLITASTGSLQAQSVNLPTLFSAAATKYPAVTTVKSVTLSGTASWIAGSDHETGTANLTAGADGSSSLQLKLSNSTQVESQTGYGDSRTCQWQDRFGKTQQKLGPDCSSVMPWFAPFFFLSLPPANATKISIKDAGEVSQNGVTLHQMSYITTIQAPNATMATKLTDGTEVDVLHDPLTLLPQSVEYKVHSDKDLNKALLVRIEYGNYESVSGVPIPYEIKKYINNTLQLSITIDNVKLN